MIESLIAYNLTDVKKKLSLAKIKTWYKGGLVNEVQLPIIQEAYATKLFSPKIIMRIFLFIATYIGLTSVLGPVVLLIGDAGETAIRLMIVLTGGAMLAFTELILIREKKHFKSGVTEAGYYIGLSFLYFGILGFDINEPLIYFSVALVVLIGVSIRYLDLLSLVAAIGCFIACLFLALESIMALLPFIIMVVFTALFLASQAIQKKADRLIWEDHFIIFDTISLLLIYLGGNYFVVREMSVEMMHLDLSSGEDIPFAFLFYGFTVLIPVCYLVWGILKKSILFIRVSLLTLVLAVITIKYYYSLGHPEVTITIAGLILLAISLLLIKYLKVSRKGYIRDQIFQSKWDNADLTAFIASQTLGGHQVNEQNHDIGQGGEFGGGGASGSY